METIQPRPIEDLLKLDSFQGMSDEEISLVVSYTAEVAAQDAVIAAERARQNEQEEAIIEVYRQSAENSYKLLQDLVTAPLSLKVVTGIVQEEE